MQTTGAFLETDERSQYPQAVLLFLYHIPTSTGLYRVSSLNPQLAGNMKFETRKYLVTLSLPKPKRKPN
jgi:hypothetical protein